MTDVAALAADLLSVAAAALPADVVMGMRVYRSICAPALDCCDQLTVHLDTLSGYAPRAANTVSPLTTGTCFVASQAAFTITLAECVVVPDDRGYPPAPEALDADFGRITAHAYAIWCALLGVVADGTLTGCTPIGLPTMTCLNPGGGCAGYTFGLSVQL